MSSESWTSPFRQNALKRIMECETFLESCGITPVAGTELEFHFSHQQPSNPQKLETIQEFNRSSFVEALEEQVLFGVGSIGEIVIGKGPNSRTKIYPKERYPSTIVRVTESAKAILGQGDTKYGMDINFGETNKKRIRSLQCNVSLWNSADHTPLFSNDVNSSHMANALTTECAIALIAAQKALTALVSPHEASFARYEDKEIVFAIGRDCKLKGLSALLRRGMILDAKTNDKADSHNPEYQSSFYFEDRLASSEADPALAMLITLGGIVNGVKSYMHDNGLVDEHGAPAPEKMKAHINSPQFCETSPAPHRKIFFENILENRTITPRNHSDALRNLKANAPLAREIMGDEFYTTFCAAYEKQAQQKRSSGSGRAI